MILQIAMKKKHPLKVPKEMPCQSEIRYAPIPLVIFYHILPKYDCTCGVIRAQSDAQSEIFVLAKL